MLLYKTIRCETLSFIKERHRVHPYLASHPVSKYSSMYKVVSQECHGNVIKWIYTRLRGINLYLR
jgi:hypothetical protein